MEGLMIDERPKEDPKSQGAPRRQNPERHEKILIIRTLRSQKKHKDENKRARLYRNDTSNLKVLEIKARDAERNEPSKAQ